MVAGSGTDSRLCEKVTEIYDWLETQIADSNEIGQCGACGKCCDFVDFDHRLFITPPELRYLTSNLGLENVLPMTTGRCPYNIDGQCTVYEYRFAACRIFCCNVGRDFQSGLSEAVLTKLKSVCTEFGIPYNYSDLATALNAFAGD